RGQSGEAYAQAQARFLICISSPADAGIARSRSSGTHAAPNPGRAAHSLRARFSSDRAETAARALLGRVGNRSMHSARGSQREIRTSAARPWVAYTALPAGWATGVVRDWR